MLAVICQAFFWLTQTLIIFFIYFLQLNSFECLICQFYQLNYNRQKMVLTSYSRTKFIRYASQFLIYQYLVPHFFFFFSSCLSHSILFQIHQHLIYQHLSREIGIFIISFKLKISFPLIITPHYKVSSSRYLLLIY